MLPQRSSPAQKLLKVPLKSLFILEIVILFLQRSKSPLALNVYKPFLGL